MSKFISKNKLSREVEKDMRGYLEYLLQEDHNRKEDEKGYLEVMPETLQKRILADKYYHLLQKIQPLQKSFREDLLRELAIQFEEKILGPGDEIVKFYNKR